MGLDDSKIVNYLVRMVVPMRREFGRKLDVSQFLHDITYATEVLEQARTSKDPRLREYGLYVESRVHGARIADSTVPTRSAATPAEPSPATGTAAAPASAPISDAGKTTEDELRARMLKKYTSGLR